MLVYGILSNLRSLFVDLLVDRNAMYAVVPDDILRLLGIGVVRTVRLRLANNRVIKGSLSRSRAIELAPHREITMK